MSEESPFGGRSDFPPDPEFISAREASQRAVERAGYGRLFEREQHGEWRASTARVRPDDTQCMEGRVRPDNRRDASEPEIPEFLRGRFRPAQENAQENAQRAHNAQAFSGAPQGTPLGAPAQASFDVAPAAAPDAHVDTSAPAGAQVSLGTSLAQLGASLAHLDLATLEASAPDVRWAWAEVDLGAIRHNIAVTRQQLQARTRLMAVVKANAYGHGALEVAQVALGAGASYLGVATVPEALELRHAGITAPILILSQPPKTSIPLLVHYALTPAIYQPDFAIAYGEVADQLSKRAPFHLAMNTGMNRIGVNFEDAVEFMYQISFHRALELEGVFTHFATADAHESLEFERQRKRFEDAIINLRAANFNTGIIHAANSAAIYRYPHVHYDMVRLGISLYGFHPCPETRDWVDLKPAMSVHARISDMRMVPMSEGVSYDYTYRSPGSVKVCTLPLGYADGLSRVLSNNMDVILGGRYYRQVGSICMDQCMFEVDMRRRAATPYYDPQIGDHVLIVGREGAAEITMDDLAEKMGTINYEVATGFGQRLGRIYT